jgi:hypothetical protein
LTGVGSADEYPVCFVKVGNVVEMEMIAKFLQALALKILFYHAKGGPSSQNVFPGEQIGTMRATVVSRWHKEMVLMGC